MNPLNRRGFIILVGMKYFFSVVLGIAISLHVKAQLSSADSLFIDSLLHSTYPDGAPGAAVIIAYNGEPVFRNAYGMANLELNVSNKPEYVFAIGSMSKQFVAISLLMLEAEGKLNLDDPVTKYLPEYDMQGTTITIRQLLNHSSGIKSFTEMDTFIQLMNVDLGQQEMLDLFMHEPLMFDPGTDWSYSNSGYSIAGMIVEKVSGMSLQTFLKLKVFKRLGMKNTHLGSHNRSIPGMVTGYSISTEGYYPAREFSWTWPFAAGGIVSNVDDMLRWDEALYTEKLLPLPSLQQAFTNYSLTDGQPMNYGLGWGVYATDTLTFIRHGGAINGFLSDGIRIPEAHFYMVVLSNSFATANPGDITNKVLNRLFQMGIEDVTVLEDSIDLVPYTGVYRVERSGGRSASNYGEDGMFRYITLEDGALYSQVSGGGKSQLERIGIDTFYLGNDYSRYVFLRDATGAITGIKHLTLPTPTGPIDINNKTNLPLPIEKKAIDLPKGTCDKYIGVYDMGNGMQFTISVVEERVFLQPTGQGKIALYPLTETHFFIQEVDASVDFVLDDSGEVKELIFNQNGSYPARKIK